MSRVVDQMGIREITIAYGLTETSPVITQTCTDDPLELRVQTVGRPLPGLEVKLVDPASGPGPWRTTSKANSARGDTASCSVTTRCPRRLRPPSIARDGCTLAIWRCGCRNGCYRITGRIKDMICRGGENIYPREIEEFLYTHPSVENVAVFGVPDPKFVEDVAAWVKLRDGQQITARRIAGLLQEEPAHYKVPRHIRIVREFPQTVTGKTAKIPHAGNHDRRPGTQTGRNSLTLQPPLMKLGQFTIATVSGGRFRPDGGTMFGVVPKVMWSKLIAVDEFNCIAQATNCVLVQTGRQNVLIDTGYGRSFAKGAGPARAPIRAIRSSTIFGRKALARGHRSRDPLASPFRSRRGRNASVKGKSW